MPRHHLRCERGFTLVELLVVIAIIGVLVALLLPAVQAAREAARRTQCTNQVKQIMTAMLNHQSARQVFPSGGITPWPNIEDYLNGPGGSPYGPEKQGLGWAFQVLPYLEQTAAFNIKDQEMLAGTPVSMFNCPSRRGPTRWTGIDPVTGVSPYLMDYAAAVPYPSNSFKGLPPGRPAPWYRIPSGSEDPLGCREDSLWGNGAIPHPVHADSIEPPEDLSKWYGYWGVIVRSNMVVRGSQQILTGYYTPISFAQIEDGSSNTFVVGEKRLIPSQYDTGEWHDDRGWTGGWDPDGLRSTICAFGPDKENNGGNIGFQFGSAHHGGMVTGFADGSVHFLNYEIDHEIFNNLAHRSDGSVVDLETL